MTDSTAVATTAPTMTTKSNLKGNMKSTSRNGCGVRSGVSAYC